MSVQQKVINFSPGPAKLPAEVLKIAQNELIHYANTGISIMEMSHRSQEFEAIVKNVQNLLRELIGIPDNYSILLMHGSGTGQFAALPMNLVSQFMDGSVVDYIVTGAWSDKTLKEAQKYVSNVNRVTPKQTAYVEIPERNQWKLDANAKYFFYTDNETIHGIEFPYIPEGLPNVPLVADMTSNFLTRPIDIKKYGAIVAGTQKNCGIAGLGIAIVRKDLIGKAMSVCPSIMDYKIMDDNNSLYNTPPVYSIYMCGLFLQWIKDNGGLEAMAKRSTERCQLIYDIIDNSNDFYYSPINPNSRSRVNIPFRVGGKSGDTDLEKRFVDEAKAKGMIQLKGHRSVGGIRASLFNAMTVEETQVLRQFMIDFQKTYKK
ncbi:probable phosphoserine aminotransferase [Oppia nitens]|uniref:probable phosphoserine aminotransferase n=1 Tax=Oppia nitens TaxID=1686743 RepID=UPI0023DB5491|nr:probable phosphoserine aminotransferase [Oppia nitens]